MVAVFVAVVDVFPVCLALDADLLIQSDVIKLNGHQGLQVHGVQQFAIVGVVLERKAVAHAKVIDLSDPLFVLRSLQTGVQIGNVTLSVHESDTGHTLRPLLQHTLGLQWTGMTLESTLSFRASGRDSLEGAYKDGKNPRMGV